MATLIRMPKMSDTMQEGVIIAWLKKEGDYIKSGDILAEIETDKATMELEAYDEGTLLYIGKKAQEIVPVNDILAIIGEKGTDYTAILQQQADNQSSATSQSLPLPVKTSEKRNTVEAANIKASPLARKIAKEKGVQLSNIQGTGDEGRIIKRDIDQFVQISDTLDTTIQSSNKLANNILGNMKESYQDVSVTSMRKTIAHRLTESKLQAPHFYLTMTINMDKAVALRANINNESAFKISINDMIVKATAVALTKHHQINAAWLEKTIRYYQHIHIGIAMAVEEGLFVPIVRFTNEKSLLAIHKAVKALGQKAKNKQLTPADWEGHTFTISNLGMFGIDNFTAIINAPAACILAIGQVQQLPIVKEGNIVPGYVMQVTLSCDHRVVDGAVGAAFLQTLRFLLEEPVKMLI